MIERRNTRQRSWRRDLVVAALACGVAITAHGGESSAVATSGVTGVAGETNVIVVTGIRPRPLVSVPRSVTVISAADIAASPSTGLADLLAQEANINLRSVTGNDKFAGVDIRGMGDTYVSNVLVLVDGVRLNSPDLSGPDLASISLEQIERIEIVRGANAVRYGGGAVGGVVNIITRGQGADPSVGGQVSVGSYDAMDAALVAGIGGDGTGDSSVPWTAGGQLAWSDNDGYRDNGQLERTDLQLKGSVQPTTQWSADASVQLHADKYGLPGPISAEDYAGSDADRRSTNRPDDGGETRDYRYRVAMGYAFAPGHELRLTAAVRDRTNEFILGYTPLLTRDQQLDEITEDTTALELTYELPLDIGPGRQELSVGAAYSTTDYARQEDGTDQVGVSSALLGDLQDAGVFVSATWFITDRWQLTAGQRWNETTYDASTRALQEVCDYVTVPGIPLPVPVDCEAMQVETALRDERWRNTATDAGVVVTLSPVAHLFANFSRAFRVPNVDELSLATADLRPQKSRHWDTGVRLGLRPTVELSVAAFYMTVEDEILYGEDPSTGEALNRNADEETERLGGEVEVRWQATPQLGVLGSAGYTHARFESGTPVPLVPDWTASLGLRWKPVRSLSTSLVGRYVASRSDGNDFSGSTYPELDPYVMADLKLTWQPGAAAWSVGVENLFDEVAAASAYSSAVYPLPGRRFHAGVSRSF
ncbi:MAG: TonB-dependent receptor [Gammaproteobacteria bacterium]